MSAGDILKKTFTPLADRVRRVTGWILHYVPKDRPQRILDLGCGTGDLLMHLAPALPLAHLTGVDIAEASVAVAQEASQRSVCRHRLSFHATDYMQFGAEPFDLIFSWGVLQCIAAPDHLLFAKIAADLADNGLLIYSMPYECLHNRALTAVRKVFGAVRSPLTDKFVLGTAKLLHGNRFSVDLLRERLIYMYEVPWRLDNPRLRQCLAAAHGFACLAEHAEPHASAAQMRCRLVVLRKGAGHVPQLQEERARRSVAA